MSMEDKDEFDSRKHMEAEVDKALATLRIHFDTVQIFITSTDGDQTHAYTSGTGNYYARYGHIQKWVVNEELEECGE